MTYNLLNKYADTVFAREFEGLDTGYDFTDSQMHDIFEVNKWNLLLQYSPLGKKMWMN